MSVVAAIRPDDWNLPLLLHVLGAMLLVGGLTAAVIALWLGWRGNSLTLPRLGFKSLLFVAFPAWWLMRIPGQWIASKEGFDDLQPSWIELGYITAEAGGLLLLISLVVVGIGVRRMGRAETPSPSVLVRIGTVLVTIVLAAYLVAVWAMSAKPD